MVLGPQVTRFLDRARWRRHLTASSTVWPQLDLEALRSVEDLPDWDLFLSQDVNPSWQNQREQKFLQRNDLVAQILRYMRLLHHVELPIFV